MKKQDSVVNQKKDGQKIWDKFFENRKDNKQKKI